MKKTILFLLIFVTASAVFADIRTWLGNQVLSEAGLVVEYNPVDKDITSEFSLNNQDSYRYGINYTGGMRFAFIENRILCDRFKPELIHFTDRISANVAIPFSHVTPFFGIGINLTAGQTSENGRFTIGLDDVPLTLIPELIANDMGWNLSASGFINCGLKAYLPGKAVLTADYSAYISDMSYNLSGFKELLTVARMGQLSLSLTYRIH